MYIIAPPEHLSTKMHIYNLTIKITAQCQGAIHYTAFLFYCYIYSLDLTAFIYSLDLTAFASAENKKRADYQNRLFT